MSRWIGIAFIFWAGVAFAAIEEHSSEVTLQDSLDLSRVLEEPMTDVEPTAEAYENLSEDAVLVSESSPE